MGREFGHHAADQGRRTVPIIGFDYMFITRRGVFERGEWEPVSGESVAKVLVIRDSMSKALIAHMVPQKGVDERMYVIDTIVQEIEWLGYRRIILKSDNEAPIVSLVKAALRAIKVENVVEQASEEGPPSTTHRRTAALSSE